MSTHKITVETTVNAPLAHVWTCWTHPDHITQWNQASPDWHCPQASNDLSVGGKFSYIMASRDGEMSFDFYGVYEQVVEHSLIAYTMGDGRQAEIHFTTEGDTVKITESFDPENMNPLDMQQAGWQAILDSFKHHAESVK